MITGIQVNNISAIIAKLEAGSMYFAHCLPGKKKEQESCY